MQILSEDTIQELERQHTDEYPVKCGLIDSLDGIVYRSLKTSPEFPSPDAQQSIRSFAEMLKNADRKHLEQLEYDIAYHLLTEVQSYWDDPFFSADTFAAKIPNGWLPEILEGRLYSNRSKNRYTSQAADQLFYGSAMAFRMHTGRMPAGGDVSNFFNLMKILMKDRSIQEAFPKLGDIRGRCQKAIKQLKQVMKLEKKGLRAAEKMSR